MWWAGAVACPTLDARRASLAGRGSQPREAHDRRGGHLILVVHLAKLVEGLVVIDGLGVPMREVHTLPSTAPKESLSPQRQNAPPATRVCCKARARAAPNPVGARHVATEVVACSASGARGWPHTLGIDGCLRKCVASSRLASEQERFRRVPCRAEHGAASRVVFAPCDESKGAPRSIGCCLPPRSANQPALS